MDVKHTRSVLGATLLGAVAAMAVACSSVPTVPAPIPAAAPTPVLAAPAAASPIVAAPTTPKKKPAPRASTKTTTKKPAAKKCTDRVDYSNDPRDNALINSIGAEQGSCPEPMVAYREGDSVDLVPADSCIASGSCYDPAGSAPGEGMTDEQYASSGEAQYDWGCRQGYITEGC